MLIMRRQTSSQQSYSPSATSRFRAGTISAARSTPNKSKVLQNGRPSCPPTSNLLGSLSVSRCIEAVAQYFSNPTVGFNGCPGQTVHFLVSQTPFIHFFIWNSIWLINQEKLHAKASKNSRSLNSSRLGHLARSCLAQISHHSPQQTSNPGRINLSEPPAALIFRTPVRPFGLQS